MSASGTLAVTYGYTDTASGGTSGTLIENVPNANYINPFLASGVLASQMDTPFSVANTFVASTPLTLTLSALPGLNGGTAKVIVKPKMLLVYNSSALGSGFNITITPGATHPCTFFTGSTGSVVVPPGGLYILSAPDLAGLGTITSSSNDQVKFDPSTGTASYLIMIFGTSS